MLTKLDTRLCVVGLKVTDETMFEVGSSSGITATVFDDKSFDVGRELQNSESDVYVDSDALIGVSDATRFDASLIVST